MVVARAKATTTAPVRCTSQSATAVDTRMRASQPPAQVAQRKRGGKIDAAREAHDLKALTHFTGQGEALGGRGQAIALHLGQVLRSEERSVGKEWVSPCRSRW